MLALHVIRIVLFVAQESKLPLFDAVKPEHVVPAIRHILAELNSEIDDLEKGVQPDWDSVVDPLERISDKLGVAWGTVSHLKVCYSLQYNMLRSCGSLLKRLIIKTKYPGNFFCIGPASVLVISVIRKPEPCS